MGTSVVIRKKAIGSNTAGGRCNRSRVKISSPGPPQSYFVIKGRLLYCDNEAKCETSWWSPTPRSMWWSTLPTRTNWEATSELTSPLKSWRTTSTDLVWKPKCVTFASGVLNARAPTPKKPAQAPLIPLPIIRMPFKTAGMDVVDSKSAQGHEYILVTVNNASRYPKAIPKQRPKTSPGNWSSSSPMLASPRTSRQTKICPLHPR